MDNNQVSLEIEALKNLKTTKKRKSGTFGWILTYGILITYSLIVLVPVIWIVMSSFQPGSSLFSSSILPKGFTLQHYKDLFTETKFPMW